MYGIAREKHALDSMIQCAELLTGKLTVIFAPSMLPIAVKKAIPTLKEPALGMRTESKKEFIFTEGKFITENASLPQKINNKTIFISFVSINKRNKLAE